MPDWSAFPQALSEATVTLPQSADVSGVKPITHNSSSSPRASREVSSRWRLAKSDSHDGHGGVENGVVNVGKILIVHQRRAELLQSACIGQLVRQLLPALAKAAFGMATFQQVGGLAAKQSSSRSWRSLGRWPLSRQCVDTIPTVRPPRVTSGVDWADR